MPGKYLPNQEQALVYWAMNFSNAVSRDPARYGITSDDAQHYATLVQAFSDSFKICSTADRSRALTAAKASKRLALLSETRRLVRSVDAQPAIPSEQRMAMGLSVRTAPVRRGSPDETPVVQILSMNGNVVKLAITRQTAGRVKPPHVIGATLFYAVGADIPGPDDPRWIFAGNYSRSLVRFTITRPPPPGTPVWFAAQWMNARLQPGPLGHSQMTYSQGGVPPVGHIRSAA